MVEVKSPIFEMRDCLIELAGMTKGAELLMLNIGL